MASAKYALVTGGAGFIGSYIVDELMQQGFSVTVLDNLSSGSLRNLEKWVNNPHFSFVKADLKDPKSVVETLKEPSTIFHFAANPEVRIGEQSPEIHFEENLLATFNLLEALRSSNSAKTVVFSSTSTVYGRASILPTPENYGPLVPISTYGASKLGCEALISSYAHTFNFRAVILRLANIIGPRSNHGVVVDFVRKLRENPKLLEILGDGKQEKSYLHIDDCVSAILHLANTFSKAREAVEIFNIGSSDQITVKTIADAVEEEMGLTGVHHVFKKVVADGSGWIGDIKNMHLSIEKLQHTGWTPKLTSEQSIRSTVRSLLT